MVQGSTFVAENGTLFNGNEAIDGAGGGIYCSSSVAAFSESIFTANEALWGGGRCRTFLFTAVVRRANVSQAVHAATCLFTWFESSVACQLFVAVPHKMSGKGEVYLAGDEIAKMVTPCGLDQCLYLRDVSLSTYGGDIPNDFQEAENRSFRPMPTQMQQTSY